MEANRPTADQVDSVARICNAAYPTTFGNMNEARYKVRHCFEDLDSDRERGRVWSLR